MQRRFHHKYCPYEGGAGRPRLDRTAQRNVRQSASPGWRQHRRSILKPALSTSGGTLAGGARSWADRTSFLPAGMIVISTEPPAAGIQRRCSKTSAGTLQTPGRKKRRWRWSSTYSLRRGVTGAISQDHAFSPAPSRAGRSGSPLWRSPRPYPCQPAVRRLGRSDDLGPGGYPPPARKAKAS